MRQAVKQHTTKNSQLGFAELCVHKYYEIWWINSSIFPRCSASHWIRFIVYTENVSNLNYLCRLFDRPRIRTAMRNRSHRSATSFRNIFGSSWAGAQQIFNICRFLRHFSLFRTRNSTRFSKTWLSTLSYCFSDEDSKITVKY